MTAERGCLPEIRHCESSSCRKRLLDRRHATDVMNRDLLQYVNSARDIRFCRRKMRFPGDAGGVCAGRDPAMSDAANRTKLSLSVLPPCELTITILRAPARATLNPAVQAFIAVSAVMVRVPGVRRCSLELPTA